MEGKQHKYVAAPGANFNDEQAQIIGQELEKMAAAGIEINEDSMIEWARPPDSPLHRFFEWDDAVAGEKWRQHVEKERAEMWAEAKRELAEWVARTEIHEHAIPALRHLLAAARKILGLPDRQPWRN